MDLFVLVFGYADWYLKCTVCGLCLRCFDLLVWLGGWLLLVSGVCLVFDCCGWVSVVLGF